MHELSQQCEARAKSTGERCGRRVVAAKVCWVHGLAAKQTRDKQQQRLALWEVQQARAAEPLVIEQVEPEQLLLDALHDTNQVLQAIKAQMRNNIVDPLLLETCGTWLDRISRLGKVITDGDLSAKLHARLGWQAEDRSQQMWGLLAAVVKAADVSAADRLRLWNSVETALRSIMAEQSPLRLTRDEMHRFGDSLLEAAAREEAAAEGITWSDSDSESDSDSVDSPLLFSGDSAA